MAFVNQYHNSDLLTCIRYAPLGVTLLIDLEVNRIHRKSSISVDSTLLIFLKTVNQTAEYWPNSNSPRIFNELAGTQI